MVRDVLLWTLIACRMQGRREWVAFGREVPVHERVWRLVYMRMVHSYSYLSFSVCLAVCESAIV